MLLLPVIAVASLEPLLVTITNSTKQRSIYPTVTQPRSVLLLTQKALHTDDRLLLQVRAHLPIPDLRNTTQ